MAQTDRDELARALDDAIDEYLRCVGPRGVELLLQHRAQDMREMRMAESLMDADPDHPVGDGL